jgi:hypothetical protein
MDDLTASLLTLFIVSPSIVVLFVLIARRVRDIWKASAFSTKAKLNEAIERKAQFQDQLCCENF